MGSKNNLLATGLAIFSMFFGAGNLIFAVSLGKEFQSQTPLALSGFLLTAVCLPVLGVVSMVRCKGSYHLFFDRIGRKQGLLLSLFAYLIIGPMVAMPRIVTLSFDMVKPYANLSLPLFTFFFMAVVFSLSLKEGQILNILGKWISPLLILSLLATVILGLFFQGNVESMHLDSGDLLIKNIQSGYATLDFLTSMFFASIVITILKKNGSKNDSEKELGLFSLKASIFGMAILAFVYICLASLGALHLSSTELLNPAESLAKVFSVVLGGRGAILMALVILLACLSTIIALSALSAEYLREELNLSKLPYSTCLFGVLLFSACISVVGLNDILTYSKPFIDVIHPLVIALACIHLIEIKKKLPFVGSFFILLSLLSLYWQSDNLLDLFN